MPFEYARDDWEKAEKARFQERRLEIVGGLLTLSPRDFEFAVAKLFTRLGFTAGTTRASADGGWDVDIYKDGERYIAECKLFNPQQTVGRPILQKLHSAMITERASGALCITTARFSAPAGDFAREQNITLIDGRDLAEIMEAAYGDGAATNVLGLCRVCGKTAAFRPEAHSMMEPDEVFKPCPEGHMAKHPFIIDGHPTVSHAERELKARGVWTKG